MTDHSVAKSQKIFRLLLQAMSHPGRVYRDEDEGQIGNHDHGGSSALMDIIETLLDRETTFVIIGEGRDLSCEIVQRTGACPVGLKEADFIVIPDGTSGGKIGEGKRGTAEYPDESATAVYSVQSCEGENKAECWSLSGPGIEGSRFLVLDGFDQGDMRTLHEINGEFPLGIDVICVDSMGRIVCIPRSAVIKEIC